MLKTTSILKNEQGSIIIVAMLAMVFLTIIGITATNTSIFESQIVGNEHRYQIDFYAADSGWKEGAMWLEGSAGPPPEVNPGTDSIVKNFGPDNNTLSQSGIPYWYQVAYSGDTKVAGSGKRFREFSYRTTSNANQTQEIEVIVSKIYKVGY
jgi:Tfp pilus assembly protein PilX